MTSDANIRAMTQNEWDAQSDDIRVIWADQDAASAKAARDKVEGPDTPKHLAPQGCREPYDAHELGGRDARWGD